MMQQLHNTLLDDSNIAPGIKLRLKVIRTITGLTQQKFAANIGIALNNYKAYEKSTNPRQIRSTHLAKIVEIYKIHKDWLINGKGNIDDSKDSQAYYYSIAYRITSLIGADNNKKQKLANLLCLDYSTFLKLLINKNGKLVIGCSPKDNNISWGNILLQKATIILLAVSDNYFYTGYQDFSVTKSLANADLDIINVLLAKVNRRISAFAMIYHVENQEFEHLSDICYIASKYNNINLHWMLTGLGNHIINYKNLPEQNIFATNKNIQQTNNCFSADEHEIKDNATAFSSLDFTNNYVQARLNFNHLESPEDSSLPIVLYPDIDAILQEAIDHWGSSMLPINLAILLEIAEITNLNLHWLFTGQGSPWFKSEFTFLQSDYREIHYDINEDRKHFELPLPTAKTRLKLYRKYLGLTQNDFAHSLKINLNTYISAENSTEALPEPFKIKLFNFTPAKPLYKISKTWFNNGIGTITETIDARSTDYTNAYRILEKLHNLNNNLNL